MNLLDLQIFKLRIRVEWGEVPSSPAGSRSIHCPPSDTLLTILQSPAGQRLVASQAAFGSAASRGCDLPGLSGACEPTADAPTGQTTGAGDVPDSSAQTKAHGVPGKEKESA